MAEDAVPQEQVEAGADYLRALGSLCLEPEGLMWSREERRSDWVLLLITSVYDAAGPYELAKILFKAFNRSILPQTIDPFSVDAYSPSQELARAIVSATNGRSLSAFGVSGDDTHARADLIQLKIGPLVIPNNGIYIWEPERRAPLSEGAMRWHRFKDNIDRLAA